MEYGSTKELDDEVGRKMWKMVRQKCLDCRQQKKHVYIPYWLSVAAVALVLLLGATWMYFSGNKVNGAKDAFVEVVSKEGRLYMLPDSSRVWMHPEVLSVIRRILFRIEKCG